MVIIGLTGGIASGKSAVSGMLRELGASVVDADAIVHELQGPGTAVSAAIAREFGPEALRPDGSVDRAALGRVVFGDPARRKVLESIVHPAVRESMWAEVDRVRERGEPAVVLDIPLLIESGLYRTVDRIWLVYVDRVTQLARLVARDGSTEDQARQRIAAQMPLDDKRAYAQLIIDNQGSLESTRTQVARAWQEVTGSPDVRPLS